MKVFVAMNPLPTGESFWKKLSLLQSQADQSISSQTDSQTSGSAGKVEYTPETVRKIRPGDEQLVEATIDPASSSKMYGLLILFSIVSGILFLIFTRFEHSDQIVGYYDEREDELTRLAIFPAAAGVVNKQTVGIYQKYIPVIQKKLKTDPANENLQYYLGVCYFRTGELDEAIRIFSTLAQDATGSIRQKSEFRLGLTNWKSGKFTAAKAIFERISQNPNQPYREKAAEILKEKVFRY